ncbi:MAG: response regulator, partial [Nitrospirae bacterium]|nr:response regulator [Nitrospirota bacterium]
MPKKILVIEDEIDIRNLIAYTLGKAGYTVFQATTGPTGLQTARAHPPDLVVLDLMIPDLDGLEVCKQIRSDGKLRGIPVLMLTAKGEETDRILGLELGADDYMTKPFSTKELTARIKALLRRIDRAQEE